MIFPFTTHLKNIAVIVKRRNATMVTFHKCLATFDFSGFLSFQSGTSFVKVNCLTYTKHDTQPAITFINPTIIKFIFSLKGKK